MRHLGTTDTRAKLGVCAQAGLLSLGKDALLPQLGKGRE